MTIIDPILLEILVCPETHQRLKPAEGPLLDRLNAEASAGTLKDREGSAVEAGLDGGLIREDGAYLYPIVSGIPVMLIGRAIPLAGRGA